uniref:Uncharacterized protein n=1 Tax=Anguilla anguilla TaxID=7936 RepID=A0A0E9XB09_ANGAN
MEVCFDSLNTMQWGANKSAVLLYSRMNNYKLRNSMIAWSPVLVSSELYSPLNHPNPFSTGGWGYAHFLLGLKYYVPHK